jgi:aryl-alcohol dehydrogenase-like predicted oxidoreductase
VGNTDHQAKTALTNTNVGNIDIVFCHRLSSSGPVCHRLRNHRETGTALEVSWAVPSLKGVAWACEAAGRVARCCSLRLEARSSG